MGKLLSSVEEYWNMVEDQYDITFEEFKRVCISPFRFIKNSMASGILKNIRIKYFGVFRVSERRVKFSKINLEKNYENKVISEKHYNKRKKVLDSLKDKNI
jgi:nucleoid DNA-binding protein